MEKTPGYNTRLEVFFQTTARGKRRAYYWDARQFRAFPMPLDKAELFVATGQVDVLPGHPFPKVRR